MFSETSKQKLLEKVILLTALMSPPPLPPPAILAHEHPDPLTAVMYLNNVLYNYMSTPLEL